MIPSLVEQLTHIATSRRSLGKTDKQLGYEEAVLDYLDGRNARTLDIGKQTGIPNSSLHTTLVSLRKEGRVTNWSTKNAGWWTLSASEMHRRKRCSMC